MGTRLKLRVCTWNVGNAQPPSDLKEWLGIGEDDYDLIVVGAQEANFGSDKSTSQLTNPSPSSALVNNEGIDFPPMSPCTPASTSTVGSSRRFKKLGKVITGLAKTTNSKKMKKSDLQENVDSKEANTPRASSSFPLRSDRDLIEEINRTLSEDGELERRESHDIPVVSLGKFTNNETPPFHNLDESLLLKRRKKSNEIFKPVSMDDPLGQIFVSQGTLTNPCKTEENELILAGLQDLCLEDPVPSPVPFDAPRPRRSRKIRQSVTKVLRAGDLAETVDKGHELDDMISSPSGQTGVKKFSQVVEKNMPAGYHLIAKHHLMEIKILLFIHERHRSRVAKTEAVTEATGIGNVVGNKGAVAVKLTLDDTSFCFVCCHLAAHEGAKFLQQRNDDVVDIMRNIERDKVYGLPVIHRFNHIFWMGDLNYRLDLRHLLPAATTWSHVEKFGYVRDLIASERFDDLTAFDELGREMRERHVFAGFTEGKLCFAPTFKVARGRPREYQQERVPSYCDRILWHSLSLHRNHVKLRRYGSVESVDTSDHKPIFGAFELVIPLGVRVYPMPAPRDCLKCTVDFMRLKVIGLYEKRVEADEGSLRYEVLDDGALSASPVETFPEGNDRCGAHTRRVVTAAFHGDGMFLKEKVVRVEVPLRAGKRECRYGELPKIALRPVGSLQDLTYKYVTIVFARLGSRQGSSCVLPFAKMVQMPGRHRVECKLELTKYGGGVASVELMAELVVSLETWIDTKNNIVRAKHR